MVIDGRPVRGRKNRWGVINIEDDTHCEFNYLRNFLTRCVSTPHSLRIVADKYDRTHLQDLIETTAQTHYESFRSKQLLALKESSASKHQQQQPLSPSPAINGTEK